ncbi:MAG: dehydrogenase, partial [Planctomycetes bacterium]|nr:dehydrogenase [Planctomycetota bacterium]
DFVGASHLYAGQEAMAVGVLSAARKDDYITSTHRGHGHCLAKGGDLKRMMAEVMGKEAGYCGGRGGSMHIADMKVNNLGANAIVGGSYGIAVGAAISVKRLGRDQVVISFVGDGSTNNGIAHEAMNMASALQVPVVFVIENNALGMTCLVDEVTNVEFLARRAAGYNMPAEVVDGTDVLAVHDAAKRALDHARKGGGPFILECIGFRIFGHSLSDDRRSYRTREEEEEWNRQDSCEKMKRRIIEAGVMSQEQVADLEKRVEQEIEEATDFAIKAPMPSPSTIMDYIFSDTASDTISPELRTPGIKDSDLKLKRDAEGKMFYGEAVNEALREEMARDKRVVLFGEDVAQYGGAFGVTRGLWKLFGPERVWNTAISEACICGAGLGAAMTGLRPVAELMYIDFVGLAMDQIANQAAKVKYMFGGHASVPLVIRTQIGGGKGYAGQHSQSLESWFTHVPGLKVVAPSTPYDAKGLLKTAIRDDNPVIFIEHQLLYSGKQYKCVVPQEEYTIPFGVADIKRPGKDVTIISYSRMVHVALDAAKKLAAEGIEAEVIDPRTLYPLDLATLLESLKKTGRVVIVAQACLTGSFSGEIASQLMDKGFDYLDAPIKRIGACDCPPPMSPSLENEFLPDEADIIAAVKEVL